MIQTVSFIGAGNVGFHLAYALHTAGVNVLEIYNRSENNGKQLANKVEAKYVDAIQKLSDKADLYIIAVKDDVIEDVAIQFPFHNKLLVHTSGSVSIDVLQQQKYSGVFYPLQTFTKEAKLNFKDVNLCVEGSNSNIENKLLALGKQLSHTVKVITSEERLKLHLAAVFACNFSNFMQVIANDIVNEQQYELLKPLIKETFEKLTVSSPFHNQTGPAIRNDEAVLAKHNTILTTNNPEYRNLYLVISEAIKNKFHGKD